MSDMAPWAGMILDLHFSSENEGLVFASSSRDTEKTEGLILRTTDGGKTWREVYRSGRAAELVWKASFPSADVGYATVQSYDPQRATQLVVKTTDGGATWTELEMAQNASARQFGIGFIDEKHGFVGTLDGGYATDDGGVSWRRIPVAKAANKFRVVPTDAGVAVFAIGTQVQRLNLLAKPAS